MKEECEVNRRVGEARSGRLAELSGVLTGCGVGLFYIKGEGNFLEGLWAGTFHRSVGEAQSGYRSPSGAVIFVATD